MHITHDPRAQDAKELRAMRRLARYQRPFSVLNAIVLPGVVTFVLAYVAAEIVGSIPMGG